MICGCSDSQCQCDRFGGVGGGRMLMTTIEVQKKITRAGGGGGGVILFPINAPGMGRFKLFDLVGYS